jgi:hypothetical protein
MTTSFEHAADNATSKATFDSLNTLADPVSFSVTASDGGKFPAPPFWVTVSRSPDPAADDRMEKLLVTAIAGDNFVATRAQEGTTAQLHPGTPVVASLVMAGHIRKLQQAVNSFESGAAGGMHNEAHFMGNDTAGPYPLGFTPVAGQKYVVTVGGLGGLSDPLHYSFATSNITFTGTVASNLQISIIGA